MRTILLGAEGHAELGNENGGWNVPWVREATPDECEAFKQFHSWTDAQYDRWSLDGMNRPYWLVTVTPEAPPAVLDQVARHSRVKRFEW
jgi:hypothetical protein